MQTLSDLSVGKGLKLYMGSCTGHLDENETCDWNNRQLFTTNKVSDLSSFKLYADEISRMAQRRKLACYRVVKFVEKEKQFTLPAFHTMLLYAVFPKVFKTLCVKEHLGFLGRI